MFFTGMSYDAYLIPHPSGETWYSVKYDEHYNGEIFSASDFADYFFTISEIRKKKLQKLNRNE